MWKIILYIYFGIQLEMFDYIIMFIILYILFFICFQCSFYILLNNWEINMTTDYAIVFYLWGNSFFIT
jgi:hypothetical protein